jgi:hypothetical protein
VVKRKDSGSRIKLECGSRELANIGAAINDSLQIRNDATKPVENLVRRNRKGAPGSKRVARSLIREQG